VVQLVDPDQIIKGVLGQSAPSGRLFEVMLATGARRFVVTGCGLALQLDQVTAQALRDALTAGIAHCQKDFIAERGQ